MKRVEDEQTGVVLNAPFLPGQVVSTQLPFMFDEVFCMKKSPKGVCYLQTESTHDTDCKDRSGKLDKNEEPDLTAIFDKIHGKTTSKPEVFNDG